MSEGGGGDAGGGAAKVGLVMSMSKKRPAPVAGAFGEEEEKRKQQKTEKIRDLDDRKAAKVIPMKVGEGWHKGRLGKDSQAEKIMGLVKMGATDLDKAMALQGGGQPEAAATAVEVKQEALSAEEQAKQALLKAGTTKEGEDEVTTLGLTIQAKGSNSSRRVVSDAEAMQEDMKKCGEETKMDDYEEMPIEEFGMALMRGMGWKDGEGLGGSRKGIIEPPEIRAQPDGLGLGATPKDKSPPREGGRRRAPKPGEERDRREIEKERIRKEAALRTGDFQVGTKVAIVSGRHRGLVGAVSFKYAHEIMVTLAASGEEVTVDKKDLDQDVSKATGIMTREEEQAARDAEEAKRAKEERRERERRDGRERERRREEERARAERAPPKPKDWMRPLIRVRVVDKRLKDGKYYLKKGAVLDVVARGVAAVKMEEDGRLLDEVGAAQLETVLPRAGGVALVLSGELRGRRGRLVEKHKDKEEVTLQMLGGDLQMERVPMDAVAEFVGQDSDIMDD